jgi:hypothetical protein
MIGGMPRIAVACLSLAVAFALTGLPAQAAPSGGVDRGSGRDLTTLFDKALERVEAKSEYADAEMLEVDGTPRGKGVVESASDIVNWRFVLDNQKTEGTSFASVTISYKASAGFGKVKGHPEPFLEDRRIRKAPKMTLKKAVSLLEDAGYRDGFANVTLRRPLGPKVTPPLYIFGVADGGFVAVDTKSGKVDPLG